MAGRRAGTTRPAAALARGGVLGHVPAMSGITTAPAPASGAGTSARAQADGATAAARPAPGLTRQVARLALLLLLPVVGLGFFAALDLAARLRAGMEASFAAAAGAGALAVAEQVHKRGVLLDALAASPFIGAGPDAEQAFREQARRALRDRGPWVALVGPGAAGQARLHTGDSREALPPLPQDQLDLTLRDGVAHLGPIILPGPTPTPALLLAVPVLRDGVAEAALATPIPQAALGAALARVAMPHGAFLLLLGPDGTMLARRGLEATAWTAPAPLRAALAAGTAGPLHGPGPSGRNDILFAAPLPFAGWHVLAGQRASLFSAGWTGPALWLAAASLLVVAGGVLLTGWFARRLHAAMAGEASAGLRVAEFEALIAAMAKAEAALRQEAERANQAAARTMQLARTAEDDRLLLESVVRSVPEPIFVKDRDLRYVLINDAATHSMGWNRRDCIGRTAAEMAPPEVVERFESQDRAVLAAGRTMEFDDQIVLERGGTRWYRTIKAPWRDSAGRVLGVVGVARDVTRRRAAEERLRAAEAAMRRIARADSLTVMSLGIAHELNQPLTAASNFQRAALRWLDQAPAEPARLAAARSAIEEASAETLRAAEILRHIRDFIHRGRTERGRVELGPLLADTVALMQAARTEDELAVELHLPPAGHATLGDRVQLQQVFVNLLRNAIEATEGQPERGLRVALSAEGGMARVVLADRGCGLPEEVTDRLFEPFVSTRPDGMGIGLSIARTIVESHGGRITARAREGGGTEFVLDLPLHEDAP